MCPTALHLNRTISNWESCQENCPKECFPWQWKCHDRCMPQTELCGNKCSEGRNE